MGKVIICDGIYDIDRFINNVEIVIGVNCCKLVRYVFLWVGIKCFKIVLEKRGFVYCVIIV